MGPGVRALQMSWLPAWAFPRLCCWTHLSDFCRRGLSRSFSRGSRCSGFLGCRAGFTAITAGALVAFPFFVSVFLVSPFLASPFLASIFLASVFLVPAAVAWPCPGLQQPVLAPPWRRSSRGMSFHGHSGHLRRAGSAGRTCGFGRRRLFSGGLGRRSRTGLGSGRLFRCRLFVPPVFPAAAGDGVGRPCPGCWRWDSAPWPRLP